MFLNSLICLFGVALFTETGATNCPNLWVAYNDACYRFATQAMTFFEAEHYCQQHNGHLVHIETAVENRFLQQEISQLIPANWWIGLSDDDIEGTYVWYGTSKIADYFDWFKGSPSNSGGHEDCVEYVRNPTQGIHWNDVDCHAIRPAICEQPGQPLEVVG